MIAERIRTAFDTAEAYDAHARVQRRTADWLAEAIVAETCAGARVLEIGCGTGFLTTRVLDRLADLDWLATDLAPAMIERTRHRLAGRPRLRFAVLDGEHPEALGETACFDLICANLAVQWFTNLPAGLNRLFGLLRPGGRLMVTTLASGTFAEWAEAHRAEGLEPGTPAFPSAAELASISLGGTCGAITLRRFTERHEDAAGFLRSLRAIGASTPRPGHRPLGPTAFRAVARRFEAAGAESTYQVALCSFTKPEGEP